MKIVRELTHEECSRRLRRAHTAVLGFAWDDEIHLLPVNIGGDDRAVCFRSHAGTKLDAATAGVPIAVCISDSDVVEHGGWSVTGRGRAEVMDGGPDHPLTRQIRPWSDTARDATWVRGRLDRLYGRELTAKAPT